jgi:integrase
LSPLSFRDYYRSCASLLDHFGKDRRVDALRPDDFRRFRAKLAERYGPVSLSNEINRVNIIFNHGFKNRLFPLPVDFGTSFDRPNKKVLKRDRRLAGPKLFERDEVLRILEAADTQMRAMILLGVNGGLGNTADPPTWSSGEENLIVDFPAEVRA